MLISTRTSLPPCMRRHAATHGRGVVSTPAFCDPAAQEAMTALILVHIHNSTATRQMGGGAISSITQCALTPSSGLRSAAPRGLDGGRLPPRWLCARPRPRTWRWRYLRRGSRRWPAQQTAAQCLRRLLLPLCSSKTYAHTGVSVSQSAEQQSRWCAPVNMAQRIDSTVQLCTRHRRPGATRLVCERRIHHVCPTRRRRVAAELVQRSVRLQTRPSGVSAVRRAVRRVAFLTHSHAPVV